MLPRSNTLHPPSPGWGQSTPCPGRGQHPYPTPIGKPTSLSHPDWLRASPGASPQLQSQFPQGLVQLIMHQVDLLSRQPEQLHWHRETATLVTADLCFPNSQLP